MCGEVRGEGWAWSCVWRGEGGGERGGRGAVCGEVRGEGRGVGVDTFRRPLVITSKPWTIVPWCRSNFICTHNSTLEGAMKLKFAPFCSS